MNTISNTSNTTNMAKNRQKLKKSVDALFKNLGTNTNSAINMFLRQCDREQGLVFTPTMASAPNKELLASLQEIEDYKNGKVELDSYKDVKELRKVLIDGQ